MITTGYLASQFAEEKSHHKMAEREEMKNTIPKECK